MAKAELEIDAIVYIIKVVMKQITKEVIRDIRFSPSSELLAIFKQGKPGGADGIVGATGTSGSDAGGP